MRNLPARSMTSRDPDSSSRTTRWYAVRAAACVVIALVIAVVVAIVTAPPDEDLPASTAADDLAETSAPSAARTVPDPTPSIAIPDQPVAATAEALRGEVLTLADQLLARYPDESDVMHLVALLYVDLQKTTEAEQLWQRCIERGSEAPGPYVGLAKAAMALGKDEAAVETLQAARQRGFATVDIHTNLAEALTKLGRLDEAAEVAQQGVAAFPTEHSLWLQLGQLQMQLGNFADAEASLLQAAARGGADATILFALATVSARQGKLDEATKYREAFQQVKQAQQDARPNTFQSTYDAEMRRIAVATLCRAATVLDHHGDAQGAEAKFLRACQLDPHSPLVCTEMVTFYRRLGRIADARVAQQRLLETEPDQIAHYLNLASLASQLDDAAAAQATLQRLIALRPELAVGYATLARLHLQQQDYAQARWFAEAAARQQTASPEEAASNYLILATACKLLGDEAAAEEAMKMGKRGATSQ